MDGAWLAAAARTRLCAKIFSNASSVEIASVSRRCLRDGAIERGMGVREPLRALVIEISQTALFERPQPPKVAILPLCVAEMFLISS
jgi:hypothetical protein